MLFRSGFTRVTHLDQDVAEAPSLTRFTFQLRGNSSFDVWVPRLAELFTLEKDGQYYAFLYFGTEKEFPKRYDDFIKIVQHLEVMY